MEKEKEQGDYANNKACCKAALLLGFANFCLMFVVNNHRFLSDLVTSSSLKTSKDNMQNISNLLCCHVQSQNRYK